MKKPESGKYKFIASKKINSIEREVDVEHVVDRNTGERKFVRRTFKRVNSQPYELENEEIIKDNVKVWEGRRRR